MARSDGDLWKCPKCGERFVTANMWHSCGRFTLDDLFARSIPEVRRTYDALARMALAVAEFHIIPQKTRVCFQLRTRCAGATPMKDRLRFHFIARAPIEHPRIFKIETFAPDQHGLSVYLHKPEEVDEQIREWLKVSTQYGEQTGRRPRV